MPAPTRWTDADFDRLGWHDVHVHGFEIRAGAYGPGELVLDLDYILEWIGCGDGDERVRFRIAPARLCFHGVWALTIALDYAAPSAALGPFSLDGITRAPRTDDPVASDWTLAVSWPAGAIRFAARGFTQILTGPAVVTDRQWLKPEERRAGR